MMLPALFLATVATPQWNPEAEVSGYRLGFVPNAISRARSAGSKVADSAVRGRRVLYSWWIVPQPFAKVARSIAREMTADFKPEESDEALINRGHIRATKMLSDRSFKAQVVKGRPVVRREDRAIFREYGDEDTYTTVLMMERPLLTGPMPRSWPAAALQGAEIPATFPGLPLQELSRQPHEWSRAMTPSGASQYWMRWYIDRPADRYSPTILDRLRATGDWKLNGTRLEPVDKKKHFVWLSVSRADGESPEIPNRWSVVELSWTDPATTRRR